MRIRGIRGRFEGRERTFGTLEDPEKLREKTREKRKRKEEKREQNPSQNNTILTKEGKSCIPKGSHHQKHL